MTVALGDAALLCGMLRPLPDLSNAAATAQATAGFYSRRTPLSTTINTLANALYQVLALCHLLHHWPWATGPVPPCSHSSPGQCCPCHHPGMSVQC